MKNTLRILSILSLATMISCTKKEEAVVPQEDTMEVKILKAIDSARLTPSFENHVNVGLLYSQAGQSENAIKFYEKAAAISPTSPLPYNNICNEYNVQKKFNAAIEMCQKALNLEPAFQLAANNLAYAKQSKANEEAALAEYEKQIGILKSENKDTAPSIIQLGIGWNTLGEYRKAIEVWKRIPNNSPVHAMAMNNIGSAYIMLKDYASAEEALKEALKIEPTNQLFNNNMAWLKQLRGK